MTTRDKLTTANKERTPTAMRVANTCQNEGKTTEATKTPYNK